MTPTQLLALLLAVSLAGHLGTGTTVVFRCCGTPLTQAIVYGGGAFGAAMALYLTAVATYG